MRVILIFMAACSLLLACGQESPPSPAETESASPSAELYSCGMHPNVFQDGPGTCPICGMDLAPVRGAGTPAAAADPRTFSGERKIKYWVAPMDPTYVSDKPGKSPMGMDLVPVYEGAASRRRCRHDRSGRRTEHGRAHRPGRRGSIFRHVRTIGTLDVAEDEVSVVNLRYSGWVERIYVDATGVQVKAGKVLFDIYSPELVSAQEEYLLALRSSP